MRIFILILGLLLTLTGGFCVIQTSGAGGGPELRSLEVAIRLVSFVVLLCGCLVLALALWPVKQVPGQPRAMSSLRKRCVTYVVVTGLILIFGIMNSTPNHLYNSMFLLAIPVVIWGALDVLTSGKSGKGEGKQDFPSEDEPS